MYRNATLNSLNVYDNLDPRAPEAATTANRTVADPRSPVLEKRGSYIEKNPTLRTTVRLLGQEQHVDNYHNDNHQDIYEVSFGIDIPECENILDWTDVSEKSFYAAIEKFEDVIIDSVDIDAADAWNVHVFRSLDIAPGYHPTEFDRPLSVPFAINHPRVASVGGASRHSMSFIVVVEACTAAQPDYDVSIKLRGKIAGGQNVSLTRL